MAMKYETEHLVRAVAQDLARATGVGTEHARPVAESLFADDQDILCSEKLAATAALTMAQCPWLKAPLDATNLRARIRADKERIEAIKVRQGRTAAAEASQGGVVIEGDIYVRVTFAEKPERAVIEALKTAGFRWHDGSWAGERAKLPQEVVT